MEENTSYYTIKKQTGSFLNGAGTHQDFSEIQNG